TDDVEHGLGEAVFGLPDDLHRESAGKFEQCFGHGSLRSLNMRPRRRMCKYPPACHAYRAGVEYMKSRVGGCGNLPSGHGLPASSWKIESQPRSKACAEPAR